MSRPDHHPIPALAPTSGNHCRSAFPIKIVNRFFLKSVLDFSSVHDFEISSVGHLENVAGGRCYDKWINASFRNAGPGLSKNDFFAF